MAELQRELCPDHLLFGKHAKALAAAEDRDDVLFEISEGAERSYAVVHLTWSGRMEASANWPRTRFFDSLDRWLEWIKADHDEYATGEAAQ